MPTNLNKVLLYFIIFNLSCLNCMEKNFDSYEKVKKACEARLALKNHCKTVKINLDARVEIETWRHVIPSGFLITYEPFDSILFEQLIENGADKNIVCEYYDRDYSLINLAIRCGNIKAVKILLKCNADANLECPLADAIFKKYTEEENHQNLRIEFCKLLLENGANPNLIDYFSPFCCPLYCSIFKAKDASERKKLPGLSDSKANYCQQIEIIKLLLKYGADPLLEVKKYTTNTWDSYNSPYEFAQKLNMLKIVKIFDHHKLNKKWN